MIKVLAIALASVIPLSLAADPQLIMVEEDGCYWCAKWNEDIAHIYPKTAEGRTAPLVRHDLHELPTDIAFGKSVHFTPTFVLVENGIEVGRIEGYPGEDFFWGLLGMMLEQAEIPLENAS